MKNIVAISAVVIGTVMSTSAFAGGSGEFSVPGIVKASGSAGSTVKNSTINVANNKANTVTAGGGSAGFKIGSIEMQGMANVNSVNVTGSEIKDSTINVEGNKAENVNAYGGTANVNSVNIN